MMIILLEDHLKNKIFYQFNGKVLPYFLGKLWTIFQKKENKLRKFNKIMSHR